MNQGAILQQAIDAVMPNVINTGLLVSLCTGQVPSGNLGPSGAPDGTYVDVAGLVNIPCTAPPVSSARITATEIRALEDILETEPHHVLLNGYYPAFRQCWIDGGQAVIDGVAYMIMGVEHDSQSQMTRLNVRTATI